MKNIILKGLLATATATVLASTVQAADYFSGPYAGVFLGNKSLDADWKTTQQLDPGGFSMPAISDPEETYSDSAFGYGVFGGYNWRLASGPWVVGVELLVDQADLSDKTPERIPGLSDPSSNPTSYTKVETDHGITLDFRGGYLLSENTMVYGSLGYATLDVEATSTCPADTVVCNPATGTQSASESETMDGWSLGLGAEHHLSERLVVRGAYRYVDYGDFSFTALPYHLDSYGAKAELDVVTQSVELGILYSF